MSLCYGLLTNLLSETVEGGLSALSVTEHAHTDAFPIASAQGEGITCFYEVDAISAVGKLVAISLTVVVDAHP